MLPANTGEWLRTLRVQNMQLRCIATSRIVRYQSARNNEPLPVTQRMTQAMKISEIREDVRIAASFTEILAKAYVAIR